MCSYSMAVKVLLIEDHPIVRAGVMPYINRVAEHVEITVAETFSSAVDALRDDSGITLIIVDLTLPDGSGLDVLRYVQESNSPAPAIVLSASDDVDIMKRSLIEGAKGFITKDTDPEIMIHALRLVHAGGVYVPEQLVKCLFQAPQVARVGSRSNAYRELTNRQLEVLELLTSGHSNKEIASQLNCAESTVKAHVTAVLKALGVANRSKAAEAAKNLQWTEKPTRHLDQKSEWPTN